MTSAAYRGDRGRALGEYVAGCCRRLPSRPLEHTIGVGWLPLRSLPPPSRQAGCMEFCVGIPAANEIAAIVADHQRALLAAPPFDIASSDRHTVKPWFDSKLALSPQVVDLAGAGFPLAGGRVEIVDGKPVPVLVYQRRAHIISVVAIPRAGQIKTTSPPASRRRTDIPSSDGKAVTSSILPSRIWPRTNSRIRLALARSINDPLTTDLDQ